MGILQPVYLPWLGFFEQMAYVDRFVFMDDVQYTRHDWRNRNRIKTVTGPAWLTVPVHKQQREARINEIQINYQQDWVRKHLRTIEVSYAKCPYFRPLFRDLADALETRPRRLVELTTRLVGGLCRYLDIDTPTAFSSDVPTQLSRVDDSAEDRRMAAIDRRNARILEICRHFGATLLYDGKSAADFVDVERFRAEGIEVVFQDYRHPIYPQAFGAFAPYQSAIDLIMNTGPKAAGILTSSPVPERLRHGA